jgi:hypothetical protein
VAVRSASSRSTSGAEGKGNSKRRTKFFKKKKNNCSKPLAGRKWRNAHTPLTTGKRKKEVKEEKQRSETKQQPKKKRNQRLKLEELS